MLNTFLSPSAPMRPVSTRQYPAGELGKIPFTSGMYSELDIDRLPVDNHGRVITGYGRDNMTTKQRMYPQRIKQMGVYVPQLHVSHNWGTGIEEAVEFWSQHAYSELVDGVMWLVRKVSGEPHKIIYHARNEEDAMAHLHRMASELGGMVAGSKIDNPTIRTGRMPERTAEWQAKHDALDKECDAVCWEHHLAQEEVRRLLEMGADKLVYDPKGEQWVGDGWSDEEVMACQKARENNEIVRDYHKSQRKLAGLTSKKEQLEAEYNALTSPIWD